MHENKLLGGRPVKRKGMAVPFFDLKQQYRSIKNELNAAVQQVMDSCRFVLGENVANFERDFTGFCGTDFAVGVANGTDALRLALLACGIGKQDEGHAKYKK